MYLIMTFIEELHEYLTGKRSIKGNIIRKHSKKLDQLGDLSFPLPLKNWSQSVDNSNITENISTIFDYLTSGQELQRHLDLLIKKSERWALKLNECKVINNTDIHLYLQRTNTIDLCIKNVLRENENYGLQYKCVENKISISIDKALEVDETKMNLTQLRAFTIQKVTSNIVNCLCGNVTEECNIKITLNSNKEQEKNLVCGSVLNENGVKDTKTTAFELHRKRALDLQLMAQHKYGIQVKPFWVDYFQKLGRSSVIIELLQNRTHKAIKVTLNNLQTTTKGPSFIFYNCARLSSLLKQFDERVANKMYPELPPVENVDLSLLNQPEEWEIIYVYILQFPTVVISTVCDIKAGLINLHNLVIFLSNLSSVFSAYYRRVKILINAKEHLLPTLFARIYLLKAIQQVFHTALKLLNIEPVKEM